MRALGNEFAFELGKRGKDAEGEPPIGGGRVDLGAGAGEHLQPDAANTQVLDRIDEVAQVAAEPIQYALRCAAPAQSQRPQRATCSFDAENADAKYHAEDRQRERQFLEHHRQPSRKEHDDAETGENDEVKVHPG